jgi:phospho-N-acetylmuramoyl-pentapeptide-transferase
LFEYISFRAGGAFFTAFLLTVLLIPPLLPFYQKHCIQKSSRTDDGKKPYKPLMGGVIIIGAVVFSALLWGMVSDRKLVFFILATLALAILGFVDDFIKLKYLRQERDGVKRNTKIVVQAIISVAAIYALYKTQGTVTMKIFLPCFKQAFQFVPGSENISVMTPFSSEAWFSMPLYIMPLCLIFMLLLNFGVLFCASNGVNLTDGKDGERGIHTAHIHCDVRHATADSLFDAADLRQLAVGGVRRDLTDGIDQYGARDGDAAAGGFLRTHQLHSASSGPASSFRKNSLPARVGM